MSRIAISGYYGFDNFGDEAILYVLLKNLKEQGHQVTVFSKSPETTSQKYNVNSVQTFSLFKIFTVLKNADVLISGGGSLLQDVTSKKSLIYYLFVLWLAQFFKKKTIIFAQGIGPVHNLILRLVTKNILKKADYISVRDERSLFMLRGWGLTPVLVNDPVWGAQTSVSESGDAVGIQLREWQTLSETFLNELAQIITSKFVGEKIKLFAFQNSLDIPVCERFKSYLKLQNEDIQVDIVEYYSFEKTAEELSKCSYLIAMRYHAVLLGLKMGIPTAAICYDIKVENIANENRIPYCMLNDKDGFEKAIKKLTTKVVKPVTKDFTFEDINEIL